jgi:hypothetical protein
MGMRHLLRPTLCATRRFGTLASTAFALVFLLVELPAFGGVVYQTDFDSLDLGQTSSYPGAAGQGGWFQVLAVGDAYGEIQASIANGGRALHEHTAATVPPSLQTIDGRLVGPVSLANADVISLSLDFYGSSSNLDAVDNFLGSFYANGGPFPGFQIIGLDLGAGNGLAKSDTGLNVGLSYFNGTNNNGPIPLTVGQNLAWDTWHTATLSLNQRLDTWLSITVDGQTQSLQGYMPMRSFDGAQWLRGQLIEVVNAQIVPDDVGGDRTDDDVYFDNVTLSIQPVPEPGSVAVVIVGFVTLFFATGRLQGQTTVR